MSVLSSFDDYCVHQTAQPIAQPGSSDRNFYDRYWFNGFDKEGSYFFELGFGIYPNRFVMDGHFSVVVGGKQFTFHASRRAPEDRLDTQIAPLSIVVVEPMKSIRVQLVANETDICCDLVFSARTSATLEPKSFMSEGVHTIMDTSRFTQFGHWQGWISVDGERIEVDSGSSYGTRDKSWGVRPVGEAQGGAPGPEKEFGIYWCWSPIHFDQFCTQFGTFEDLQGNPLQLSASKTPAYASMEEVVVGHDPGLIEMDSVKHTVQWHPGTRLASSAQFDYSYGQESMHIELTPIQRFYMLAIGYQHPEWGHGVWKGDMLIEREQWMLDDLDPLDYKHIHTQQIVTAQCGDLQGIGTLETIVFGAHKPSGFKDILDGAV